MCKFNRNFVADRFRHLNRHQWLPKNDDHETQPKRLILNLKIINIHKDKQKLDYIENYIKVKFADLKNLIKKVIIQKNSQCKKP